MEKPIFKTDLDALVYLTEISLARLMDLHDSGHTIRDLIGLIDAAEIGINQIKTHPQTIFTDYPRLTQSVINQFGGDVIKWLK